jgi:hypothetical protein
MSSSVSASPRRSLSIRLARGDVVIPLALALTAAVASYLAQLELTPAVFDRTRGFDVWFESDLPRVYANMTDLDSNHYRARVHPLFSLTSYSVVKGLRAVPGIDGLTAVRLFTAATAGAWIVTVYALLRLMSLRRLDSVVLTLLAGTSATSFFWLVVPDTYALGSISILAALAVAAAAERRRVPDWSYVATSAATLSFTLTNWMAGLLTTLAGRPLRRAIAITAGAFAIVTALWLLQKAIIPTAPYFVGSQSQEQDYLFESQSGGLLTVAKAFVSAPVVMPQFGHVSSAYGNPILSVQLAAPWSAGALGAVAFCAWAALLMLGLWAALTLPTHRRFRLVVGGLLLGQFALDFVYVPETFVYAMHIMPALLGVVALSCLTRARWVALALAVVIVVCGGASNAGELSEAFPAVERLVQDAP